jgi:Tol biopolymer transport system component
MIYLISADGGEAEELLPGRSSADNVWSPDGRFVLFGQLHWWASGGR